MPGRYPAIVTSYNEEHRTCGVSIPGITDNADESLIAEIEYPIGDKSRNTELEIIKGDTVWIAFIGGDVRYPIITGYRCPQNGNTAGTRYYHHANIGLNADKNVTVGAGKLIQLGAGSANAAGSIKMTASTVRIEGDVTIIGNVTIEGGTLTHNNINVGSTHTHGGVDTGSGNTSGPI